MTDLQERNLREAIASALTDAYPSFDVMAAVRQRHLRLRLRAAIASAAITVVVVVAVLVIGLQGTSGQHPPTKPVNGGPVTQIFPGGGRLLLLNDGQLRWLYPNGKTLVIPGVYNGAAVVGTKLLAWRYGTIDTSYYTMTLSGQDQREILPAGHDPKLTVILAQLSPDGSKLAYIRQDVVSATNVVDTLWVLDVGTDRRSDLGTISTSAFAWRDNSTVLAAAPDGKSLQLISVTSDTRSTYLKVSNATLVRAYERARPGAGPPAYIGSDGLTGSGAARRVAIWLAAASPHPDGATFPQSASFISPAEVVLAGSAPIVSYAPSTPQQLYLGWGPDGLVLLQTGAGDDPGSWKTYAGTVRSFQLSKAIPSGMEGVIFNPAGNVIAIQDNGGETFMPTPGPACRVTVRCLNFAAEPLPQAGMIQAWLP